MDDVVWMKHNYKLFKGRWGIAILMEAGHTQYSRNGFEQNDIKVSDGLYFRIIAPDYPESQPLCLNELNNFCVGLQYVSREIIAHSPHNRDTLILLRSILFSECNIQDEAFTAAAMEWAGTAFGFSVTGIQVDFNAGVGVNGKYIYQFK